MSITINEGVELVDSNKQHAAALLQAVEANREHLAVFLPWVPQMLTIRDCKKYLRNCQRLQQQGLEYSYNIFEHNKVVGRIGLSRIDPVNKIANIGYWLVRDAVGKGIISKSVKALMPFAYDILKLNRLEIKAMLANTRSRAIPEHLGFQFEGILRQAELVHGQFQDLALYSLLRSEWKTT
ncbi:GNAT family protein [Niabella terrae]